MRKSLISLSLWTVTLGVAAAFGCSAPDPGVGYLGPRHPGGIVGNGASGDDGGSSSANLPSPVPAGTGGSTPTGGTTSTPTPPGSTSGGTDAGAPSEAGTTTTAEGGAGDGGTNTASSFLGETTAFASSSPATSARSHHQAVGQAQQQPTTDCLACHQTGGAGAPFLAAGWVATAANGTTGATGVEVRVYAQGANAGFSGYTDTDGFFWINPPVGGATGPYQGGVRDGTTTNLMAATQTAADCQTCHGGAQGPIHLP